MTKFKKWHAEISCLQHVSINRGGCGYQDSQSELHTFCDASQDAYAAVVYLRTVSHNSQVSIQLLIQTWAIEKTHNTTNGVISLPDWCKINQFCDNSIEFAQSSQLFME